jgi:hypothetical protein
MLFDIIRAIAEPAAMLNETIKQDIGTAMVDSGCDETVANITADILSPCKIAKGVYDVSSLFTWFNNQ